MSPFLATAKAAAGAAWARRGLIAVGALVLLTTFGLGYAKGRTTRPSYPPTPYPPIIQISETDREASRQRAEDMTRNSAVDTDEDIVETRTTAPPTTLPDGSTEQRTRIKRKTAKAETETASLATQEKVVEKIVEKRVEVPCPPPPEAGPPPAAQPPRFLAGISAARDLSLNKTVYGVSGAVRTGPVFWRLFVDSHPQAGLSLEVFW